MAKKRFHLHNKKRKRPAAACGTKGIRGVVFHRYMVDCKKCLALIDSGKVTTWD